jgi:hypothetical protein
VCQGFRLRIEAGTSVDRRSCSIGESLKAGDQNRHNDQTTDKEKAASGRLSRFQGAHFQPDIIQANSLVFCYEPITVALKSLEMH